MERQYCPFHTDEDLEGRLLSSDVGYEFRCDRSGHPQSGAYTWTYVGEPPGGSGMTGLAAELGLDVELPAVLKTFGGHWVEYGVVERAYALSHPDDWARLIDAYGHTAIAETKYSASAFLAKALGSLARAGALSYRDGEATGRWSYNSHISWWAHFPEPSWDSRLSWVDDGPSTKYVPGSAEGV